MQKGHEGKNLRLDKENNARAWEAFKTPFRGMAGSSKCKKPLLFTKEVEEDQADGSSVLVVNPDHGLTEVQWHTQNDELYSLLCVCCQGNVSAIQVLEKHTEVAACAGMDDGRSAYLELQSMCTGGETIETAEGVVSQMFSISEDGDMADIAREHLTYWQRIKDLVTSGRVTVDLLIKMHLLRLLRFNSNADQYLLVEEKCSEPGVSYEQTSAAIIARNKKLAIGTPMEEGAAMFTSNRTSRQKTRKLKCFRCGSKKHLSGKCPHPPVPNSDSDSEDDRKPGRQLGASSEWGERAKKAEARVAELEEELSSLQAGDAMTSSTYYNVDW